MTAGASMVMAPNPADGLSAALDTALSRPATAGPLVVLFSGGVDSSLLAWEVRNRPGTRLLTVGREGSADLRAAGLAAEILDIPWTGITLRRDEVRAFREDLAPQLVGLTPTETAVQVAVGLAVARAPGTKLLCGQGADELFLGYAHFGGLSAEAALRRSDQDLAALLASSWPTSVRIARELGRELIAPYLDPGFVDEARRIPISMRLPGSKPKSIFREWAMRRGLPPSIALRPKRAFQYGSGVANFLKVPAADR